jgi:hypothetical protein
MNICKARGRAIILVIGFSLFPIATIISPAFNTFTAPVLAAGKNLIVDGNGNFFVDGVGGKGFLPYEWEIIDPDGVNCRYEDRQNPGGWTIYNYPSSQVYPKGQSFSGVGIFLDDRGDPWIWVGTSVSRQRCWVRANNRLVRPIRQLPR